MLTAHSKAVIVINSVFPLIASLSVAFRLYARSLKSLRLNSSDYAILVALAITVAHSMVYIYFQGATDGGMGQHIEALSNDELTIFGKVTFWNQFPYIFAASIIKVSILLFYRSIFSTRRFRVTTDIVAAILLLWTIAFFFASLFQAWPISKNWKSSEPGHTIDEFSMYLALACSELVLDVLILTLPWTMVWRLQMDSTRKWIICGIFALGSFVCVSSGFRIYYFHTTHTSASQDFTYDTYNIFIWTVIEPCLGVICACLPTLGPLFQGRTSVETLIGTIRSYLRLGSQSKTSGNQHNGFRPFNSSAGHPANSYPDDACILTSIKGRRSEDLESRFSTDAGIYVGTKVSTSESKRQAPGV